MQDRCRLAAIDRGMGMFDITWVGVPARSSGIAYMVVASRWLLPDRDPALSTARRSARIHGRNAGGADGCRSVGKTIEKAGLRHLPGMYLAEIDRDGEVIRGRRSADALQGRRPAACSSASSNRSSSCSGFAAWCRPTDEVFKLEGPRSQRVPDRGGRVSNTLPAGRQDDPRGAVPHALQRGGHRRGPQRRAAAPEDRRHRARSPATRCWSRRIPSFAEQQRNSRDFFLVSRLDNSSQPRHERAGIALAILIGMVVLATAFENVPFFIEIGFSMLHAAAIAGALMLITRCCSIEHVRQQMDWQVLITIAATLGIGTALGDDGARGRARGRPGRTGRCDAARAARDDLFDDHAVAPSY